MIGKPQVPAKPRMTRDTAKPDVWTQLPNRASDGVALCTFKRIANASGPTIAIKATRRIASCAKSLRSSTL